MFALTEKPIEQLQIVEWMTQDMEPVETPERYAALRAGRTMLEEMRLDLLTVGDNEAIEVLDVILTRVRRALRRYEDLPTHQVVNAIFDKAARRE